MVLLVPLRRAPEGRKREEQAAEPGALKQWVLEKETEAATIPPLDVEQLAPGPAERLADEVEERLARRIRRR